MNPIVSYFISIKNEILKLKRTFSFYFAFISALFIPVIYLIYYLLKYKTLIPADGVNPWDKFLNHQIMVVSSLLIPLFIVLITSLIIQIEHKSSGIKLLFSFPVPKWSIYFGKLTTVIGMVFITYIVFFIIMLFAGVVAGTVHEDLNLLLYTPNYVEPIKLLFRSFTATLGILGIQFWFSFRMKNFIIPIGVGMVLIITGLIVFQAKESIYFPYAYSKLSLFSLDKDLGNMVWFPKVSLYSVGYFLVFSIFGFIDIHRMNIK